MEKTGPLKGKPLIEHVAPGAAISGGEIAIFGRGFAENGATRPKVLFGDRPGDLLLSSPNRLVVRVPEGVVSGELTVDTGRAASAPVPVAVGMTIADTLHPVANPAIDGAGNIFTTLAEAAGKRCPPQSSELIATTRSAPS